MSLGRLQHYQWGQWLRLAQNLALRFPYPARRPFLREWAADSRPRPPEGTSERRR